MSKQPIDESRVLKEGFLTKKGSNLVKQWKERWFVIRGTNLFYYRNPRDKKPVGSIPLKDVSEIVSDSKENMPNCFRLVTRKKVFLMSAQTPDDRDNWIKTLEVARTGFEQPLTNRQPASPAVPVQAMSPVQTPVTSPLVTAALHTTSTPPITITPTPTTTSAHSTSTTSLHSKDDIQTGHSPRMKLQVDGRGRSASSAERTPPSSPSKTHPRVAEAPDLSANLPSGPSPKLRNQSRPKAATAPRQRFISEPRQIATAKYDYTAGTERELTFKAGDKIVVIKKYESGWWLGELDGKIGHFPASYAESESESTKTTRVRALYDYTGTSHGELSFKKDDEFILLEKLSDGGWWRGQIDDKKGHFPASFVQIIEDTPAATPELKGKLELKSGSKNLSSSPPSLPKSKLSSSSNDSSDQESEDDQGKVMSLGRARGNLHKPKLSSSSPASPPSPEERLPTNRREAQVIGQYQLGEMLGKGAFGVVYRGLNMETGAFVAVKQIATRGVPKGHLASVMTELQLLKELKHPNIVQYIALIETRENINFVLEYIEGGSLEVLLKKFGKMPEVLIVRYTQQILAGLEYLHSRNVIHRDIKCGNILITKDGTVKLADFGIATNLSNESGPDAAGSPYWMAPEIIELRGACTASDIWSLGCAIIELITGDPPFSEMAPMAALFAMVEQPHPPLPSDCSPQLRDFLLKCFDKDTSQRWSATKLLDHPLINPNSSYKISSPTPEREDESNGDGDSASYSSDESSNEENGDVEGEGSQEEVAAKKIAETANWLKQAMDTRVMTTRGITKLVQSLEQQLNSFKTTFPSPSTPQIKADLLKGEEVYAEYLHFTSGGTGSCIKSK